MSERGDLAFINHILDSINAVIEFSAGIKEDELISNRLRRSAIIREIEVIGEAAKNLSLDLKNIYNNISWKEIIGSRDRIIHQYFGVDLDIIWDIIKNDLPILKEQIEKILKDLK